MSSEPTCINLQERFGRRYRVGWEANGATRYQWPEAERAWLMELRCRHGLIYPKGGKVLQATTTRQRIGAKLRALPCVLTARGDVEVVITFHVDDVPAVFRLLQPYRRRQVSAAQRERLRAVGFQRKTHSESGFPALGASIAPVNDAEAAHQGQTPRRRLNRVSSTKRGARNNCRGDE